jgi:isopentenyl diphosphate isomerase/L-lactate dehydrogenase-like FMN-dependent dehydrogenase
MDGYLGKFMTNAALTQLPADLVSVNDYARYAREHIPHSIYEYIAGGGADEVSLQRNRQQLDAWHILPSALVDCSQGTTQTEILGQTWRHPMMLAPIAFHKLVHPEGEIATAQAASILETGMMVSTLSSVELETISDELESPKWFQLYFQQSRDFTFSLVKRAEAAGYTTLVITVDAALHGIRNRAQRAGFTLPDGVSAVNLKNRPPLPNASFDPSQSIVFQGMMSEAPTWDDIIWLQSKTEMPIVLKGILNPSDALKAQTLGIAGVVVSNHGGRTLDCLPSSIEMLPQIREVVGDNYLVLFDGGIERGTDVFKALALGANAVLIGRPQLYSLAVAGGLGVGHMLRILREELEVTMALAGTPTIDLIDRDKLLKG